MLKLKDGNVSNRVDETLKYLILCYLDFYIFCIVYLGLSAFPSGDEFESAPSAPYILNSSHVIRSPVNRIMQGIR